MARPAYNQAAILLIKLPLVEMIIGIQEVTSVSMASWCPFSPGKAVK